MPQQGPGPGGGVAKLLPCTSVPVTGPQTPALLGTSVVLFKNAVFAKRFALAVLLAVLL